MHCQSAKTDRRLLAVWLVGALLLSVAVQGLLGCGTPAAPLAPTLRLPLPVKELSATRIDNTVHLKWTMPRRSTDNLLLEGKQGVFVWRLPGSGKGDLVGDLKVKPGVVAEFADKLPPQLQTGSAVQLSYTVELLNHLGQSASVSSAAYSASGPAPAALSALSGEYGGDGVHLHWQAANAEGRPSVVRITRKVLDAPLQKGSTIEGKDREPPIQTLLVAPREGKDGGVALDATALSGRHYEYGVSRLSRLNLSGRTIELLGLSSNLIRVETKDVFAPAPPQQVVAVAVPASGSIDLAWSANTEPDLAGYVVYRKEAGGQFVRISPQNALVVAPVFRDTKAEAGRHSTYAVSAVDTSGNESARSAEVEEALP